jgi:hypothetical protein
MMKKLSPQGFGTIGIFIVIVILATIGFTGWAVYHHDHKNTTKQTHPNEKTIDKLNLPKPTNSKKSASSSPTTITTPSAPSPILGEPWAPDQEGYGDMEPSTVNNGGDPTGTVTDLTWQSWGGSQATGQGISTYVSPEGDVANGTQEKATVVTFDLGTCQGKTAYTAIEWYFPQHGGSFDPNHYRNICTGDEVGS